MTLCTACGWEAAGPCYCARSRKVRLVSVYEPFADKLLYELMVERAAERDPFVPKRDRAVRPWRSFRTWLAKRPIATWYLVYIGEKLVGQIQLHEPYGSGIIIREKFRRKGYGMRAMRAVMKMHADRHWLVVIHPKNRGSIRMFKKLGYVRSAPYYEYRR